MPTRNSPAARGAAASAPSGSRATRARSRRRMVQSATSAAATALANRGGRLGAVGETAQTVISRLGPFAPPVIAVAGRYALKKPLRTALIVGALWYLGRRWWTLSGATAAGEA